MMDAYDLYRAYEHEQNRMLERRPICSECGEHIQEEKCHLFDGKFICPSCMEEHEVWTEDYERGNGE